jgi:hypothetical protein
MKFKAFQAKIARGRANLVRSNSAGHGISRLVPDRRHPAKSFNSAGKKSQARVLDSYWRCCAGKAALKAGIAAWTEIDEGEFVV